MLRVLLLQSSSSRAATTITPITSTSEQQQPWLFFDLLDTASHTGVAITAHRPTVHDDEPPAVVPQRPWEGQR